MGQPGIFEASILSGCWERTMSKFITAMHPKSEVRFNPATVRKLLSQGWVGQPKIHGHRVQLHVPADPAERILAFNRQGEEHQQNLTAAMQKDLRYLFSPASGWNVIDGEWLKSQHKIFLFDFLQREGQVLRQLTYGQRYEFLPRLYRSDCLQTLPVLTSIESCLRAYEDPSNEGLVFKSMNSPGFANTSIIRCRRPKIEG